MYCYSIGILLYCSNVAVLVLYCSNVAVLVLYCSNVTVLVFYCSNVAVLALYFHGVRGASYRQTLNEGGSVLYIIVFCNVDNCDDNCVN